ncbi:MAG: hypothetical protein R6U44_01710 [Archaeoglobaceae archaeon]
MRFVLIQYFDHVEFRSSSRTEELEPLLREVVGWIIKETHEYVIVLSEKAATDNTEEISKLKPSGFVILKSDIKNMVEIGR